MKDEDGASSTGSSVKNRGAAFSGFTNNLFSFFDSFRLRIHPICYTLFMISFMVLLSVDPDQLWGPIFNQVLYYGELFRNLALDLLPYDGIGALLAIILAVHLIVYLLLIVSYRMFIMGNSKIKYVKRVIYVALALFGMFPYVPFYISYHFVNCDYAAGVLEQARDIKCWDLPNVIWAVVAYITLVSQIIMYALFLFTFASTKISKFNVFGASEFYFVFVEHISTLFCLVLYNIAFGFATYSRFIINIVQCALLLGLLWYIVPFYHRVGNSIYSGSLVARGSIPSLVSAIINTNNLDSIGIPSAVSALLSLPVGFIIGFIAMEIYARVLFSKAKKYIEPILEGNLSKVRMKTLEIGVQFSVYDQAMKEQFEKAVKLASLESFESARIYLTLAGSFIDITTLTQAQFYLQKCMACRPNLLVQFSVFQRYQDIDVLIGDRKSISRMIDLGQKAKDNTNMYITMFFRALVSEKIDYNALNRHAQLACENEKECDKVFQGLIGKYPKNANVSRVYAQYLEEFKFNKEAAMEYYADAEALEIQEQERSRQKRKAFTLSNVHEDSVPEIHTPVSTPPPMSLREMSYHMESSSSIFKSRSNIVTPSSDLGVDESFNDAASFVGSVKSKRSKYPKKEQIEADDLDNQSVGSQVLSEVERRQDNYLRQVSKKENKYGLRIIMYAITVLMGVYGIIMFNVTEKELRFVSTDVIRHACLLKNSGYEINNYWRNYQKNYPTDRNGTNLMLLRNKLSELHENIQQFKDNLSISKVVKGSDRYKILYENPILIQIPVIDAVATPAKSVTENVTGTMYQELIVTSQTLSERDLLNTSSSYVFMFFNYNRSKVQSFFGAYCNAFGEDFKVNDLAKVNVIGALVGAGVGVHVLYIVVLFIPAMYLLFSRRKKILKLFELIPKDIIGTVYQKLKTQRKNKNRVSIKRIFPTTGKIAIVLLLIALVECISLVVVAYEGYIILTCDDGANDIILSFQKVQDNFNILAYVVSETMYPDPILGYAYTASAPTLLAGYLVNLKNAWTTVRFGTGTATGVGISGVSSEIDSILDHPFCNNTQNIDCMSLDRIMVVTDFWVNNHIQNYKNYTMQQRLVVANDTFKVAMRGLSLSTEAIKIYTAISQASCTLPIPSAIVYLGVFILLLLLVIPLHVYVQHYMDVNHRIRCMLAFIPSTTNDNIPRLVEYVNGFNLYTIDTDKIGKNKSMNYMETFVSACLDGALICSERATIICVNTAVRDMFRCNAEDVVGQPLNVLFDTTELENIIIDILKIGTGVTKEFNAVRKDKSIYPARVSVSSVTFDKKRYLICFISDLTVDHKQKDLIAIEKKNNEKLLLSILPAAVATRLKKGETCISEKIESCTCFFSDMVGFTKMSSTMSAANLVETLNAIVNRFDDLSLINNIEKIKTIGDAYFCVGGLHSGDTNHPQNVIKFAMQALVAVREITNGHIQIRAGAHTGPLVAGVIGKTKFAYDCWGDTVNMASRMESTGLPGRVQISRATYERVHDLFPFEEREGIEVKGKGTMTTYLVIFDVEQAFAASFNQMPETPMEEENNNGVFDDQVNEEEQALIQ